MSALHEPRPDLAALATAHVVDRQRSGAPLGRSATAFEIAEAFAPVLPAGIQRTGIGVEAAWSVFRDAVDRHTVGLDSSRFLAFIPMAPSTAAVWMDAVVGASSFSAESWLEAAGAVAAENQVLEWLVGLAGLPSGAGGCFMSGGSIGNLSALTVARDDRAGRRLVAVADTAHASIDNALHILGLEPVVVPTGADGRFTGAALRHRLDELSVDERDAVGIVVAAAGSTNAGLIDDLDGLAAEAQRRGAWFHVDAAYGGAALLLPELRDRFLGIERADSFIVDPHKWLFSTSGSCAVVYRDPSLAREVHTQHGPYIDVLRDDEGAWNPSDLGFQLTRRATGLPVWFSLVVHGADAHADGVRRGVELATLAAERIAALSCAEVVLAPELSVVLFRRHGWGAVEWGQWARRLLEAGIAFVAPTTWRGEPVGRLVFLHPDTTVEIIDEIVATLA
jgi:glutamate/tyrosine decarboxylase-like PLP-dependent enzyme